MDGEKQKLIRTIGTAIMAFSGMVILANALGALVWVLIMPETEELPPEWSGAALWPLRYYLEMCLVLIIVGVVYLVGGFYLRKFKLWAQKALTMISVLVIMGIMSIAIISYVLTPARPGLNIPNFILPMTALFWSGPFSLLIWFLNRQNTLQHFGVDQSR